MVTREVDVAMIAAGLSISTRLNTFSALRSVAKYALEAKAAGEGAQFLPLAKRGTRVPSALPAGDVAAVIDAVSCPEHQLVILLAAHAGLRKGEIRALLCMDVELDKDRLVVRLSRYRTHTRGTKSGNERQVPLSPSFGPRWWRRGFTNGRGG
jgi:integrase